MSQKNALQFIKAINPPFLPHESDMYEHARIMLDATPLSCNLWDVNYNIVDCNQETVKLFELSCKQEYLDRFFELSPEFQPDGCRSNEKALKYVEEAFEHGSARFEWMHQRLNGELLPSEITLMRVKRGCGYIVAGYTRDLREQKKAMAKLRAADDLNRIILDAMPMCCHLWDENLNIIDCNQEAIKLFGMSGKEEFLAKFQELSPEFQPDGRRSREKAKEYISLAFGTERLRFEWLHQKHDGEQVPSDVTLVRCRHGDNYIVVAYVRDLRELKNTVSTLNRIEKMAFTDSLTGIYNRRYFMDSAQKAFAEFPVKHKPISLIMFDLDKFKDMLHLSTCHCQLNGGGF